jgi:hypothetical protein
MARYEHHATIFVPHVVLHPDTGVRCATPRTVETAQAAHTRKLGDHQEFGNSNPQFDASWERHVADNVRGYRLDVADGDEASVCPAMDSELTTDTYEIKIIKMALAALKNDKAHVQASQMSYSSMGAVLLVLWQLC